MRYDQMECEPPTIRATLLDDLRRQLLPVADDADGDAEAWIGGGELYVAIRLCLLARDGRHAPRHGSEAECLFGLLVAAYTERGGYVGMVRGQLVYHAPSIAAAAEHLAVASEADALSRPRAR